MIPNLVEILQLARDLIAALNANTEALRENTRKR